MARRLNPLLEGVYASMLYYGHSQRLDITPSPRNLNQRGLQFGPGKTWTVHHSHQSSGRFQTALSPGSNPPHGTPAAPR